MPTYSVQPGGLSAAGSRTPLAGFFVAGGYGDNPVASRGALKSISGHVYDVNGAAVVGATVDLYRQADSRRVNTTTSTAGGAYYFNRDPNDTSTYYTVAYSVSGGSVQIHGVSDRGLVPS